MIYVMFVAGLCGLFFGGEFLVRGAIGIARRFSVPPLVIGLTVVGFGTSMPELLVSVQAALAGAPALAIGNVVGSNIANILLILGLTALILPPPIAIADTRRDFAVMIGVTVALWALLLGSTIWRWQGVILVVGLGLYLHMSLRSGKSVDETDLPPVTVSLGRSVLLALGGLVVLMIGARLLVDSATEIARTFGVSEAVIGLTIVAIGTSLPELAVSALAALRGHSDVAVGNIVGSNIFNILGIIGLTAILAPIPVDARFAQIDMWIALGAALWMLYFAVRPGRVSRGGAAALLAGYAAYPVLLA